MGDIQQIHTECRKETRDYETDYNIQLYSNFIHDCSIVLWVLKGTYNLMKIISIIVCFVQQFLSFVVSCRKYLYTKFSQMIQKVFTEMF